MLMLVATLGCTVSCDVSLPGGDDIGSGFQIWNLTDSTITVRQETRRLADIPPSDRVTIDAGPFVDEGCLERPFEAVNSAGAIVDSLPVGTCADPNYEWLVRGRR